MICGLDKISGWSRGDVMRQILTALVAAGSIAVATASTASAQWVGWEFVPSYSAVAIVEPVQTVQTVETVRTIRPMARSHRQIVTRRSTVRSFASNTYSRPLYLYAGSAPTAGYRGRDPSYARPLYNTVAMPVTQTLAAPVIITVPAYRYVYQWDRILVIDPSTNLIVQTLPR
jgi:hypothetical protein